MFGRFGCFLVFQFAFSLQTNTIPSSNRANYNRNSPRDAGFTSCARRVWFWAYRTLARLGWAVSGREQRATPPQIDGWAIYCGNHVNGFRKVIWVFGRFLPQIQSFSCQEHVLRGIWRVAPLSGGSFHEKWVRWAARRRQARQAPRFFASFVFVGRNS